MLSVIVPYYNSERFIVRCAYSLFSQSLEDIEFVFVDDASTDQSAQLLRSLINESGRDNIINIHNNENIGASLSREIGLHHCKGEYVVFCDADDYVDHDYYALLYERADKESLDVAIGQYKIGENHVDVYESKDYLSSTLEGTIAPYLWNKLIKRELYLKVEFPKHDVWEDFNIMTQIFTYTLKVGVVTAHSYYHYNVSNSQSLSKGALGTKTFEDMKCNLQEISNRLKNKSNYFNGLHKKMHEYKQMMIVNGYQVYMWNDIWPEINYEFTVSKYIPWHIRFISKYLNHDIFIFYYIYHFFCELHKTIRK